MTQNHAHAASNAAQVDDQRILQLAHDTLEIEADACLLYTSDAADE
jgi:hypothetical protein